MNAEGLDALDSKILKVLENNARATFSEIGESVGLSRVAVKNRIEAMEKSGIILGYKTVFNSTRTPQGVRFVLDVETLPDYFFVVMDALGKDKFFRQIYITTGDCRLHAVGFAPNTMTLDSHVRQLYGAVKGIRRITWHHLLTTIKDVDGGVEYVRYQESEHLESE